MSAKYFHSELAYLREMGREFAVLHPSTAGLLSERGSDPDVERLLEGFAFLTARIRERVDDAAPLIVHGLTELLLPHLLRPYPASSLVAFEAPIKALRGVHRIPRGSELLSREVNGTACSFRTTADVDLLPLVVRDALLDDASATLPKIQLSLRTTEVGRSLVNRPEGVRFHLHGDESAATISLWLLRHCSKIRVRCGETTHQVSPQTLQPAGFAREEALVPWPAFVGEGYRYLQEFFALPAKFHAFDFFGLAGLELLDNDIEVEFECERPPKLPGRLNKESFRLFCTPVVNLFEVAGEPIRRDPLIYEHLVRAVGMRPANMEVFTVNSVVGIRSGETEARTYLPFYGFQHAHDRRQEHAYHVLRRTESPLDEAFDCYLSIVTPRDTVPSTAEEVLSLELTCTNRALPDELQLGDIHTPGPGTSAIATFRNITPVTAPARIPFGSELHWRCLSHLAANRRAVADPEALRAMLGIYNLQLDSSPQVGRTNARRIEAIRAVQSKPVTRLLEGAPVRGMQTVVELEESNFSSWGDAHTFGAVLDALLAEHVGLNSFNELVISLHPSQVNYRWNAKNGQKTIL